MAVTPKQLTTTDKNSGRGTRLSVVRFVKVGKHNRKGVTQLIGGKLVDYQRKDKNDSEFHILLKTKVNKKEKELAVEAGHVVFQTGREDAFDTVNSRWQVLTIPGFRKRFPDAGL